jgi:predicted alpha/beta-hydrolase family hydrolase
LFFKDLEWSPMTAIQPYLDATAADFPVRGFLHRPETPGTDGIVLTHGAGSNCQTPLLVSLADAFCASGLTVLRCDLPFRQARPHGPPPPKSAERDQAGLRAAVASLRRELGSPDRATGASASSSSRERLRIFLGGHSYGGRQASMLAASGPSIAAALLLLSFPLHPPDRPTQLRSGHFPDLKTPALFVHGERDGFGTDAEMQTALALIPAPVKLLFIPAAGHELLSARNRGALPQEIVDAFLDFLKSTAAG